MKRQFLAGSITFFVSCALGWFCAIAGGAVWGTFNSGLLASLVIIIAGSLAVLAAFFPGMNGHD